MWQPTSPEPASHRDRQDLPGLLCPCISVPGASLDFAVGITHTHTAPTVFDRYGKYSFPSARVTASLH